MSLDDLPGYSVAIHVFCELFDEYTRWMTRNPLLQPRVDYLWTRYHGLIPAVIRHGGSTKDLGGLLISREQKHRRQIENEIKDNYTPRTLDLIMVLLCREGLKALAEKEKESQLGWSCEQYARFIAEEYHGARHRRPEGSSQPRDASPRPRAHGADLPQRADHGAEPPVDPAPVRGVVPDLVHGRVHRHGEGRPGHLQPHRRDQGHKLPPSETSAQLRKYIHSLNRSEHRVFHGVVINFNQKSGAVDILEEEHHQAVTTRVDTVAAPPVVESAVFRRSVSERSASLRPAPPMVKRRRLT